MPTADSRTSFRAAVEEFLYSEAALLDDGQFTDWLALFTSEAHYWIPATRFDTDPTREVSIVYDDFGLLSERIWRMDSGLAYAQEPRSRTSHLVSNVRLLDSRASSSDAVESSSRFVVTEFRRGAQHTYAGRYRHRLRPDRESEAGFRIELKKVELVNVDGHLGNVSLIL